MMGECRRYPDLHGEQGQLLPMFAVGMLTLILFAALVTNVGQAVVRKHQLQLIADMGAMAGAAEQARGLNTMARLNALNLRAFNVFQIRSRLGGYQTNRLPFVNTLTQLLQAVPKQIGVRTPSFLGIGGGCHLPLCYKPRSILSGAIQAVGAPLRIFAGVGLLPWDPSIRPKGSGEEVRAFRNMDRFHEFLRNTIKAANYYYAYNAHQVARQTTDANLKVLLGTNAPPGRQNSYQRLVKEYNDTKFSYVSDPYDVSAKAANAINGIEGILEGFKDPATILNYLIGGVPGSSTTFLGQIDAAFRPLIPNWENPDGDPLVVRFWSAMPSWRRHLIAGVIALPFVVFAPLVYNWVDKLIIFEEFMRFGSAPSYSTLNVTLHRAPGEDNETYFLHWVRTPTTESAVGRMLFADMPVMVAVAAAKPVGGNFGNHPRPEEVLKELLEDISSDFGALLVKADKWVNKILPPIEYLVPDMQRPRSQRWRKYEIVALKEKLSGDWVPDDLSFFWYRGQNFPTYEPRLMPIKPQWIPGMGLYEVFVARDVLEVDDITRLIALNRDWNFE